MIDEGMKSSGRRAASYTDEAAMAKRPEGVNLSLSQLADGVDRLSAVLETTEQRFAAVLRPVDAMTDRGSSMDEMSSTSQLRSAIDALTRRVHGITDRVIVLNEGADL